MNWVIVVAGGYGRRMDLGFNKIFAKLGKFPLLYWTLVAFGKSNIINNIIISASEQDIKKIKALIRRYRFRKILDVICASHSRQDSTLTVLQAIKPKMKKGDLVGVHNAVNPFVRQNEIRKVYKNAKLWGAAILAQAAKDTVKIADEAGLVKTTPLRKYSWYAQTPQVAGFENLYRAHLKAQDDSFLGTDDAQLLERVGIRVKIVPCSSANIKITFREDLAMAREILKTWTE